jgi:multiple sugar transport system ATP-binding protein
MVLPEASAVSLKPGDRASVAIDPHKIHVFRAANGQAMA